MNTYPNKFILHPANTFLWNYDALLDFLIINQGQSIVIDTRAEGVCLETAGVYKLLQKFNFTDVTIITSNLLEKHDNYIIKFNRPFRFFKLTHSNYSQFHNWNLLKKFACFYNRPLWHRLGIAAELQYKHKDISMINVRTNPHHIDQSKLFEVQKLFEYAADSFKKFAQVSTSWPSQIESQDSYTKGNNTTGHTDQLAAFYPNFLIDMVAETWTQGNCFFPTEKTVRPMLMKKPMIVMGPVNYLEYLRQMGFRTFGDFWDEDYDGYGDRDRYHKILLLIDNLAKMSTAELQSMYYSMQYTLDHNYNLLISQSYNRSISHVI